MFFCCSFAGTNNLKEWKEEEAWTKWAACSGTCYDVGNPPVRLRYQILYSKTEGRYNNTETQICEDVPLCNGRFGKKNFLIESIYRVKTFINLAAEPIHFMRISF